MNIPSHTNPVVPVREIAKTLLAVGALAAWLAAEALVAGEARSADTVELLNVSYDPTRELYKDVNQAFEAHYEKEKGKELTIKQSHGGSSSQARAVIDGLQADILTLAMWPDTDAVQRAGLIASGWEDRLPNRSVPYTSTIVFLVRKGNPKGIADWSDLGKSGVEIVTPNPKTSGNGKLSLFAIWGSVTQRGGSEAEALDLAARIYAQAPVLDTGARGSTTTFVQKKIGDVLLTWENEAHLALEEAQGTVEIVYPPVSILADPPVTRVDAVASRKGTAEIVDRYLAFLYTDQGQEIAAKHFYRPSNAAILAKHAAAFPSIRLFSVNDLSPKGWQDIFDTFFAPGKFYDQVQAKVQAGR